MVKERIASRFTFELVWVANLLLISAAEGLFAAWVAFKLGLKSGYLVGIVGGLGLLNMILARNAADRIFKAYGLSRSGRTVEGRRPAAMLDHGTIASSPFELRSDYSSASRAFVICFLGLGAFIFLLTEVVIPRRDQMNRESVPTVYGIILGLAALAYALRYLRFRILRIDDDGITAERGRLAIRPSLVPWSEIASCELIVHRDTCGKISAAYPVFKDGRGDPLFPGLSDGIVTASPADQKRVLEMLKDRFPKLVQDPWEL